MILSNKINNKKEVSLKPVKLGGETFYKLSNSDELRPFFMSIVSDSNHWMFLSSNGGLSAGRKNAEYSLFPYYTDDKITESVEVTGSKSIFILHGKDGSRLWEPFSERYAGIYNITRNLYKNIYGNKIMFEEINHDLDISFRYQWNNSDKFGFVRRSTLINHSEETLQISMLDGVQNIVPAGVGSYLQNNTSNLGDAYKRSEMLTDCRLGIYALSAIIVDKAEPSEALKANVVWSLGIEDPTFMVSSLQLNDFRKGKSPQPEEDVKAEKGAYFIHKDLTLGPNDEKSWMIVANVNLSQSDIIELSEKIKNDQSLQRQVIEDVNLGTSRLVNINAAADALQCTADDYRDSRHFSNTLFNIMRGGIFDDNYNIERWDFAAYLKHANKSVFAKYHEEISALPELFSLADLRALAETGADPDFKRLCLEYMPLKFSRRHGDPSRPWNRFSINTRSEVDGSKILDYEGNWRDIFQNWEALSISYPLFLESMILKFLNASTFDGYNPYRVTKGGFDWETIEPDDPWSYIGYWGDHQIIYLLKFLEMLEDHAPGQMEKYFDQDIFVYANVPYRIKSYEDILENPKDTIEFDLASDEHIREIREKEGADGALLRDSSGNLYHVNFVEKILATLLAKLSNFIPEGGIWMNTQRPEWNDANNALVGNGVSMVTLYYIHRFLTFFQGIIKNMRKDGVAVSEELATFFWSISDTLEKYHTHLTNGVSDRDRKSILDGVGRAGSNYRNQIYNHAFSGIKKEISVLDLKKLIDLSLKYMEQSIGANERPDHLYHAYNLMTVENDAEVSISYLSEMLEGQVAVLSSGYLSPSQALEVLDGLKASSLFRPDQYSYILYPNKDLPRFMEKNNIPAADVEKSSLLQTLLRDNNTQIINQDIHGGFHFNGNFRNANLLKDALRELDHRKYGDLVAEEEKMILQIFEDIFNHKAFTGRSGTFFGYEGLGSIYWHMVSKLQLAVQECCLQAIKENASPQTIGRLLEHYYEINEGIGVHKPPSLYGAFPTDPYSHTPAGRGAQQPGMTGQVKEDILSRFGELGVFVVKGRLTFDPVMLRKEEFLSEPKEFKYIDLHLEQQSLTVQKGSLAFTYCQIPVIYQLAKSAVVAVKMSNGETIEMDSLSLDLEISKKIFARSGEVVRILVKIPERILK